MHPTVAGTATKDEVGDDKMIGCVTTHYAVLEAAFGPPAIGPSDHENGWTNKTSCMWSVRFKDGIVATLYDHDYPKRTAKNTYVWHISGRYYQPREACLDAVRAALPPGILILPVTVHHTRILDEQAARKARLLEDMKKAGLDPKSKCGKAMLRGYE